MAEERDRRRIERELQAEAQRHAQSRHREHAQGVAVGEAENALVAGIDHAVVETRETRGDLLRVSPPGAPWVQICQSGMVAMMS